MIIRSSQNSEKLCPSSNIEVIVTESDSQLAPGFTAAEMVEVYEAAINNGWDCRFSNGEALSRALALELHPELKPFLADSVIGWLEQGGACDCISTNDANDQNIYSNGCG